MAPIPSSSAVPRSRSLWWPEGRRAWVSAVFGTATTLIVATIWAATQPEGRDVVGALGVVLTWALLVGSHAILTFRAFNGLSGEQLEEAIEASSSSRDVERTRPSWSVQVSSMALIVVALLLLLPSWRAEPGLVVLALVMVAASWADMVISFALHYAAVDGGSLDFPGDEPRTFSDYLYLAVTVQATFGLPDVAARTSAIRRHLSVHTLVSFVFNTVILAVVVTLLVGT